MAAEKIKEVRYDSLPKGAYIFSKKSHLFNISHDIETFTNYYSNIAFIDNLGVVWITDEFSKKLTKIIMDSDGHTLPYMKSVSIAGYLHRELYLLDRDGNLYLYGKMYPSRPKFPKPKDLPVRIDLGVGKIKEIYGRKGAIFVLTQDNYLYVQGDIVNDLHITVGGAPEYFSLVDIGQVKKMHEGEDILIETISGELWYIPPNIRVYANSLGEDLAKLKASLKGEDIKEYSYGTILTNSGNVFTLTDEGDWIIKDLPPVSGIAGPGLFIHPEEAELETKDEDMVAKIYISNTHIRKISQTSFGFVFVV
jgi:hypothetical protein